MRTSLTFTTLCLSLLGTGLFAADHPTLPIGSSMPGFELPGVDGKTYTPADFSDAKILAVIFTSNHCPTAQAYEARIKQLVTDYTSKGVAFVAINPNHADAVRLDEMAYTDLGDTFAELQVRAAHKEFNFPYLDDGPEQVVSEAFGPAVTPHVFIFDDERKLRFEGRIDDSEGEKNIKSKDTRAALDALLAGKEPPVTTTRVFGCSVKWKEKAGSNTAWLAKVAEEPVSLEMVDAAALVALRENAGSGKVRMINVWATWCGPCVSEFDDLVETSLRFRGRDFELVTVSADNPDLEPKVLKFLERHNASMQNVIFNNEDKYALIEAIDPEWKGALPHTLLINPEGEIIYRETGSLDFLELRRAIVPALDAVTPWPGLSD